MPRDTDAFPKAAFAVLLCGAIAIGFAPIFMRWSPVAPSATAFWRIALALPVYWTLFLWPAPKRPRPDVPPRAWLWLFVPGLFFVGDLVLWHWAVALTSVSNSTVLVNGAPIFVTLFAWLLFRERITAAFVMGLALALAGTFLLVRGNLQFSKESLLGDALAVGTAMFYASYQLSAKRVRARFSTIHLMAFSSLACCLGLFIAVWLSGERFFWEGPQAWRGWLPLLGLALVCHVTGQGCIVYALAHLPSSFSSVTLLVQPCVATIAAWAVLGEGISLWQFLGGTVILSGILVAQRGAYRAQRVAPTSEGDAQ